MDTTFNGSGETTTALSSGQSQAWGAAQQPDGKIFVAGFCTNGGKQDFAIVRYKNDGSLDGGLGSVFTNTLDGTPSYTENNAAVVLDPDIQIYDAELSASNVFSGATLTLSRNGGTNAQDTFSATGTLAALTEGGNLVVGGTTIGTVTTNSGGTLLLTFNVNATNTLVNLAMQQIAYSNASDAPPASVQIEWSFNDGNTGTQGSGGALNCIGSTTVYITAANDAPTATNLTTAQTYTEDTAQDLTAIVVSDVDSASVTVTLTLSDPAAGSLNTDTSGSVTSTFAGGLWTASGAIADVNTLLAGLNFTPSASYNTSFTITTSVSDGVAAPVTGSKAMTAALAIITPPVTSPTLPTPPPNPVSPVTPNQVSLVIPAAPTPIVLPHAGLQFSMDPLSTDFHSVLLGTQIGMDSAVSFHDDSADNYRSKPFGSEFQINSLSISLSGNFESDLNAITQVPVTQAFGTARARQGSSVIPLEETDNQSLIITGAFGVTGVLFTAGIIWWASRSAGLLAGLAAILPAWRHLDPLAILDDSEDEHANWGREADIEVALEDNAVSGVFEEMTGKRW